MNKSLPPTSIDVDRKLVDGLCVCVCVCKGGELYYIASFQSNRISIDSFSTEDRRGEGTQQQQQQPEVN